MKQISPARLDPTSRESISKSSSKKKKPILLVAAGLLFIGFYYIQSLFSLDANPIAQYQKDFNYKVITGVVLLFYLYMQWRLFRARENRELKAQRVILNNHQWQGVIAPLILYIHTVQLGYGYQWVLTTCFMFTILSGILSPSFFGSKSKLAYTLWLPIHVLFATSCTLLLFYHVFIVFSY